jgi:7-carboxy-7-deazaguanine synthase (Cx14CxxC type)
MSFQVKEIFRSVQGEGVQAGKAAVFCRFAGCNLWSGKSADRATATCGLCDTDFTGTDGQGGGVYADAAALAAAILDAFGERRPEELFDDPTLNAMAASKAGLVWNGMAIATQYVPYVIFTGGEPALQLNRDLIETLRRYRLELAVETNGTLALPDGLDWVTVSPKAGTELVVKTGQELKLLWPQPGIDPAEYAVLPFEHFVLQAVDAGDPERNAANVRLALEYCLEHPEWRFGAQVHKLAGFK